MRFRCCHDTWKSWLLLIFPFTISSRGRIVSNPSVFLCALCGSSRISSAPKVAPVYRALTDIRSSRRSLPVLRRRKVFYHPPSIIAKFHDSRAFSESRRCIKDRARADALRTQLPVMQTLQGTNPRIDPPGTSADAVISPSP